MKNEPIATAKFIAKNANEQYDITLDMIPSNAFDYGNRHSLVLDFHTKGGMPQVFDARYDKRWDTAESFDKYAYDFVRGEVREDLILERIS